MASTTTNSTRKRHAIVEQMNKTFGMEIQCTQIPNHKNFHLREKNRQNTQGNQLTAEFQWKICPYLSNRGQEKPCKLSSFGGNRYLPRLNRGWLRTRKRRRRLRVRETITAASSSSWSKNYSAGRRLGFCWVMPQLAYSPPFISVCACVCLSAFYWSLFPSDTRSWIIASSGSGMIKTLSPDQFASSPFCFDLLALLPKSSDGMTKTCSKPLCLFTELLI